MNKLKKNLSLQVIYQVIATITPLITSPYLSRKLGASSLGLYSYTYSIISYFMLFCMMGFVNYGTRSIALLKNNKDEKQIVSEIYAVQLFFCFFSTLLFLILLLVSKNKMLLIFQSLWILSCFFDVTWYFFGKENFKTTVIRNLIIKLITIICIFLFIKNSNDLLKYIIIMGGGTLISQFSLWILVINKISINKDVIINSFSHFKPVLLLFIPILAMSIYHIMDKTMLGLLSTPSESGFYFNADKVVNIPLCILTGIGTVMLSNISNLLAKNNSQQAIIVFKKSIKYLGCLSIAMAFGIAGISKDFVPLFFGAGYEKCITLVQLLSIVIIFKSISDILRTQYMIPFKREKYFIIAVIVGAIVNFILNILFIYYMKLDSLGATLGTIIAEVVVCILQLIFVNKDERIVDVLFSNIIFIIFGIIMYSCIIIISHLAINILIKLLLEIAIGGLIYVILTLLYFLLKNDEIIKILKFKYIIKKGMI